MSRSDHAPFGSCAGVVVEIADDLPVTGHKLSRTVRDTDAALCFSKLALKVGGRLLPGIGRPLAADRCTRRFCGKMRWCFND